VGSPFAASKNKNHRTADIQDDENEGDPVTTECIGDATGKRRIRKLRDRVKHIDEQIAELQDKKEIMLSEIQQLKSEKL